MRQARFIGMLLASGIAIAVTHFGLSDAHAFATSEDQLCTPAKALANLKAVPEARQAYTRLLIQHPGLLCARRGLAAITNPDRPDPAAQAEADCTRGDVYRDRDLDADAKKAYDAALEKNVNADCAKDGLAPSKATALSNGIIDAIPVAATLLGTFFLLLLALLLLGYIRPVGRVLRRAWVIGYWLRPRLTLADLDDSSLGESGKVGVAMTGRIRERLQRFRERALDETDDGYKLDSGGSDQALADIVAGDGQLRTAISKLSEVGDHGKVFAALADIVLAALPIRRLTLAGAIEPSQANVPAATLLLSEGPRLAATAAIDTPALPENPKPSDYLRLCDAAAVWVQYEVARQLQGGTTDPDKAESYSLVTAGLDFLRAGDVDQAIRAFQEAIGLQRSNWSAHVNLFTTMLRYGDPVDSDELAIEIKSVMAEMEREEGQQ